jgi:hypothetical protein
MGLGDDSLPYGMITGLYDSPLARIFRQNGYFVQIGTRQGYALSDKLLTERGPSKNKYIDRYFYDSDEMFSASPVCISSPSTGVFNAISRYYWFCQLASLMLQPKQQGLYSWPKKTLAEASRLPSDRPVLTITYLYYPIGHTHADYEYNNLLMRESYRNYFNKASTYLTTHFQQYMTILQSRPSDAFVIVLGDHGTYAKQGNYKTNAEEVIDKYNVFTAVLKIGEPCHRISVPNGSLSAATSPTKQIVSIINCLKKDTDPPLLYQGDHSEEISRVYGVTLEDILQ